MPALALAAEVVVAAVATGYVTSDRVAAFAHVATSGALLGLISGLLPYRRTLNPRKSKVRHEAPCERR